jgi:plastocyanin
MRRARGAVLLGALCALAALRAGADANGELSGTVSLGVGDVPLAAVAPIVVYLDPQGVVADAAAQRLRPVKMRQRDARFAPSFLVVAAGQSVEMANDDAIYHNVFSYSRPNDFDLGLYPAGESRTLPLRHPGVVKLYCSIHESMNATILVTPARWFAIASAAGRYAIPGIPPGRYRAVVWAERLPATEREIEIVAGQRKSLDWVIGAPAAAR